jgi:hypothetical protein
VRLDVGGGAHVYYKRTSAVPAGADVSELIENATVTVGVGNQVRRWDGHRTHPAPSSRTRHAQPRLAQMRTRRAPVPLCAMAGA